VETPPPRTFDGLDAPWSRAIREGLLPRGVARVPTVSVMLRRQEGPSVRFGSVQAFTRPFCPPVSSAFHVLGSGIGSASGAESRLHVASGEPPEACRKRPHATRVCGEESSLEQETVRRKPSLHCHRGRAPRHLREPRRHPVGKRDHGPRDRSVTRLRIRGVRGRKLGRVGDARPRRKRHGRPKPAGERAQDKRGGGGGGGGGGGRRY
jgi:hypothetical protein